MLICKKRLFPKDGVRRVVDSVAAQTSLCLTWSKSPKIGFLVIGTLEMNRNVLLTNNFYKLISTFSLAVISSREPKAHR